MPGNNNNNGSVFSKKSTTEPKISQPRAKWMQRMTWEVNKFPYSHSRRLALYSFERGELEWYYKEIRVLADKVLDILECPYCEDTIKKAVLPGCGCQNPSACCSKCWLEAGSVCLNCRRQCSSLPFEPIDEIVRECYLFYKERGFQKGMNLDTGEVRRITESYYRFLKQSEMELMCDYCFSPLEKTMTVSRGDCRKALCTGCHELYMECYKGTDPHPFPTFDRLNSEFSSFFAKILTYCDRHKDQVYSDPLHPVTQPNLLKLKGLQRTGVKGTLHRLTGIFKKAVAFAVCAYLVMYFVK